MTNITPFVFEGSAIRMVRDERGEPCFVARDVAEALKYPESSLSNIGRLIQHVPDQWKGRNPIPTLGGMQEVATLSEQGVYFFLARSDKPKALPFQMWLAGEVVPAIREHGAYATPQALEAFLADPDTMIRTLQALKAERERRAALEAQAERDRPKAIFADSVAASSTSILVGDFSKILRQNGHDVGQKRLFEWLRENGYLMRTPGSWNMPTQRAMELGLFEVKESTVNNPDGSVRITKTTKVTGKGQIYFVNKFHSLAGCAA